MGLGPERYQLSAPASVTPRPGAAEYWVNCHPPTPTSPLRTFCLGLSGSATSSDCSLSTHPPPKPSGTHQCHFPRTALP